MRKDLRFRRGLAALAAALLVAGGSAQALPTAPFETWAAAPMELAPTQVRAGGHGGGRGRPGGMHGRPGGGHGGHRPSHRPGGGWHGGGHHGGWHGGAHRPGGWHGGGWHGGVYRGGAWVRPYRWAPGGAIAAGAAIGFVTAATAAAWASAPPRPGLCWYYTDPSRRSGFWDVCP